jgi:hypothetical protein
MNWLNRTIALCAECNDGPKEGNDVRLSRCRHCRRVGCEAFVDPYRSECVPEADDDSCLEYVEEPAAAKRSNQ